MEPFMHLVAKTRIEGSRDLVPGEPLREALSVQEKDGKLESEFKLSAKINE